MLCQVLGFIPNFIVTFVHKHLSKPKWDHHQLKLCIAVCVLDWKNVLLCVINLISAIISTNLRFLVPC